MFELEKGGRTDIYLNFAFYAIIFFWSQGYYVIFKLGKWDDLQITSGQVD